VDDEPNEAVNEQQPEYDGNDAEAPFVTHQVISDTKHRDGAKKHSSAARYIKPTLRAGKFVVFLIWTKIFINSQLWMVLATVVMAISTAVYTRYAWRQWKAVSDEIPEIRKSADAAQKAATTAQNTLTEMQNSGTDTHELASQAKRQAERTKDIAQTSKDGLLSVQRAFIFPTPVISLEHSSDNKFVGTRIAVRWENAGVTPTRKMTIHLSRVPMLDIPPNFEFPDLWSGPHIATPSFVGPKGNVSSSDTVFISPATADLIADGKYGWFIWGWAKYHDIFKGTPLHETDYCYKVIATRAPPDETGASKGTLISVQNCERHNCYDDECNTQ
jgi:hypothetical protein